jgi:coenzyme A diphosphatase NUDT7
MFQRLAKQLQLPRGYEEVEKDSCGIKSVAVENDQSSCVNWRERRAAVLICLFEGQEGELRVILTKRCMKMASHPGIIDLPRIDDVRCMLIYTSLSEED